MDERLESAWRPLRERLGRQHLENYLLRLSRYYQFISMHEAVEIIAGGRSTKNYPLAITFDDGYRNNLEIALPVLKRFNVSPTIFVATGHHSQRKPFWFDRLDYAIQNTDVAGRTFRIGGRDIFFASNQRADLSRGYKSMRSAAKEMMRPDSEMIMELEKLADNFEAECGKSLNDIYEKDPWSSLLTWEEIEKASQDGITFGSHTVDHVRLGLADEETIRHQLEESRKTIEKYTNTPCRYLCYPSGSFSKSVISAATMAGYQAAVTTLPGLNRTGGDLMSLRRIHFPERGAFLDFLGSLGGWHGFRPMASSAKHLFLAGRGTQVNITGD